MPMNSLMVSVMNTAVMRFKMTYLAVKTTGGLIEEKKKLRFSRELYSNGKELALLHVQTLAGHTDNRVGEVLHIEHLDDLFHVVVLLLLAHSLWLTEHSAESETLTHCGGFQVKI